MDREYQVSVIICVYNPILKKLLTTLKSCFLQKDINVQFIVADDGSRQTFDTEIKALARKYGIESLTIANSITNQGTVENIYSGLLLAKGKYTYIISPGDYFFDDKVLSNLFRFCEEKDSEICFGKSQYYMLDEQRVKLINQMDPSSPQIYSLNYLSKRMKALAYCTCQGIVGASFFRRTDVLKDYIEMIRDVSRYDEDDSTSFIHLLLNKKQIDFFDGYVVWYEYGTGISTSNNSSFLRKLEEDRDKVLRMIDSKCGGDDIIGYMSVKGKIAKITKYPFLCLESKFVSVVCKGYRYKNHLIGVNDFFRELHQDINI